MEEVEHNCFLSVAHHLHDVYAIATTLDHRGKDSTGLFAWGPNGIDVLKWRGPPSEFRNRSLQKIFPAQNYFLWGMHGRYKTRGVEEINLQEAHPITLGGVAEDRGNHLYIRGCKKVIIHNGQIEDRFLRGMDKSKLKTLCDSEALLHYYDQFGIEAVLRNIPDGYTLAIADVNKNGVLIARGRFGLKPGVFGTKDCFDLFASESVALRELRATFGGEIVPGAVYYLRPDGKMSKPQQIVSPGRKNCMFEFQYTAHPHTNMEGVPIISVRRNLGKQLANEFPFKDFDFVSYVPESPEHAAIEYSRSLGVPLIETFYKKKDGRSFQQPTQKAREESIDNNLYLLPEAIPLIKGKRGVWIEDSFIRGTVAKATKKLVIDVAGVKEAILLSYTPQIGIIPEDGILRGCDIGGVDMPSREHENHKFLARNKTVEQMSNEIGVPIRFLSIEGMEKAYKEIGIKLENLCTFCIGGHHPFDDCEKDKL